ncbi:hypothetical protein QSE00_23630 [Arenibacter sp. M-2]|uniref:hypothetical protein n=1 Tax=Arenibacter sp. M-2 TaxID=3053612 RepID=UPI00256FF2B7|nr:hypothetical protein [Arenibacter sp. M-2]MDL5514821.1 hypothetical protein [Arenibacter sp. M-2]
MKSLLSNIGTGIFIAFWLFLGLKGCVNTVYSSKGIAVYENLDANGESNKVYFIPSNKIIVKKQYQEQYEYAVFYVRGTDATHYFGPFYNKGENLLGIRTFPDANEVWKLEMEITDKKGNLIETTFDDIGDSHRNTLVIKDNSIEFGDYEYEKLIPTEEDLELINKVNSKSK